MSEQRRRSNDEAAGRVADLITQLVIYLYLALAGVTVFLYNLLSRLGEHVFNFVMDPDNQARAAELANSITVFVREQFVKASPKNDSKGENHSSLSNSLVSSPHCKGKALNSARRR